MANLPIPNRGLSPDSAPMAAGSAANSVNLRQAPQTSRPSRPPTAFVLFRSYFVRTYSMDALGVWTHREVNSIVGKEWRAMTQADRLVWEQMAETERVRVYSSGILVWKLGTNRRMRSLKKLQVLLWGATSVASQNRPNL
ncbi:hypothetical protein B0J17DRAFT_631455 [Rhizoctonia solani]|nr:hypothetical protein B0J17DRAFT_631455 [Rhizoctonia solani]